MLLLLSWVTWLALYWNPNWIFVEYYGEVGFYLYYVIFVAMKSHLAKNWTDVFKSRIIGSTGHGHPLTDFEKREGKLQRQRH